MKKFFFIASLFAALQSQAAVIKPQGTPAETFAKIFKEADAVKWSHHAHYSQASFIKEGIITKAYFDKNGALTKTMRYYNESHLPAQILAALQANFAKEKIWGITEISQPGSALSYQIVLQNNLHWIYANVATDGSIAVARTMKRA